VIAPGVFVSLSETTAWAVLPALRQASRSLRRLRSGYISAALVVLIAAAAIYTLPVSPGPRSGPPAWRMPPGVTPPAVGVRIPVFCLPGKLPALRCGLAEMRPGGAIGFAAYGSPPDRHATIPLFTSADIGLLWSLADPAGRAQIHTAAANLAREAVEGLRGVIRSGAWQREYRKPVSALLERAATKAWDAPDTQAAFRAVLQAIEPVMQDSVANQIGPAIAPYVAEAFWRLVKANATEVFSLITGSPLDLSSIGATFTQALQDKQVQKAIGGLAPRVIGLPQTELLVERFAANMAGTLEQDSETSELLIRIAMDPRLGKQLRTVREDAGSFLHQLGRVLWGFGNNQSMNSLAGLSVKAALLGASEPLILLLEPDTAALLVNSMPGRGALLVPDSLR
jgi:hypothetical protein